MLLSKKLYSLILVFTMAASVAFAQVPQQMPQQQQDIDVSDGEINQFASVFVELQSMNQGVQQEMMSAVADEGIEVQRFNEIMQAQQDPNQEVDASEDELQNFAKASQAVEQIQAKVQKEMEKVITENDLTVQRYQQIMMAVRTDTELQQRLQQKIQQDQE
ncbi:protein of unknown function [Tangfeifania diversioriginum]|uniref:DUF4168 domain-containing protein n=1 Tax=Tangfeifania diversioriginum TaxID=1168035 RepID=A0A1M6HBJ4_9BACT|nr:DUF4168 domain-containing protein [Tangfeifania diversioriginum]SHJ19638.1 protein of unknown function [Tangfeifania diversioriginum]